MTRGADLGGKPHGGDGRTRVVMLLNRVLAVAIRTCGSATVAPRERNAVAALHKFFMCGDMAGAAGLGDVPPVYHGIRVVGIQNFVIAVTIAARRGVFVPRLQRHSVYALGISRDKSGGHRYDRSNLRIVEMTCETCLRFPLSVYGRVGASDIRDRMFAMAVGADRRVSQASGKRAAMRRAAEFCENRSVACSTGSADAAPVHRRSDVRRGINVMSAVAVAARGRGFPFFESEEMYAVFVLIHEFPRTRTKLGGKFIGEMALQTRPLFAGEPVFGDIVAVVTINA